MILPVLDAFAESFARVVVPMLRDGLAGCACNLVRAWGLEHATGVVAARRPSVLSNGGLS